MAATFEYTFTDIPAASGEVDLTGSGETEVFVASRNTNGKVALQSATGSVEQQVKKLADAIGVDYNTGQYTITYDSDTVYVEHFDNTHFDSYTNTATNTSVSISTTTQEPVITLVDTYDENTSDKCTTILMDLAFSVDVGGPVVGLAVTRQTPAGGLVSLYSDAAHNSNTLSLAIPRENYYSTTVTATIGATSTVFNILPPKYILNIEDVAVNSNPYSADVTITSNTFLGSDENEYALEENGISSPTYYTTNVFSAITEGLYTAFIKDKYGCVKSESVTVEEGGNVVTRKEIFVSRKNSHFFQERTNATATTGNVKNWLSFDDPYPVKPQYFYQIYSDEQLTTTQFWSSYPKHTANLTIVDPDPEASDIVVSLPITQRTDNINRDDYLEGVVVYDATYGGLKVSFVPGDVYDADGNVIDTHTYDGVLPDYYVGGTFIRIGGFDGIITEIVEDTGIYYAITNIFDTLISGSQTIHTIHLALDYEVFEFDCDFDGLAGSKGYLTINAFANTTTSEIAKIYNSEFVEIIEHADLIAGNYHICYFFGYENDSEINYTAWQDGVNVGGNRIEHLRNLKYEKPLSPIAGGEVTTEKLDNQEVKLDYKGREIFQTNLQAVPALYAQSLARLFDETEVAQPDGLKMVTIAPSELEQVGQYQRVKVQLAVQGGGNEFLVTGNTIKSYYPVVV